MKLGKSPEGRIDRIRFPDKLSNAQGFGFVEIEFCDVTGVEIHGGLSIAILEEMHAAVVGGHPLYHDGAWGRATLEVALAINTSAEERRDVLLEYQVPMPLDYDAGLELYANSISGSPGTST